MGHAPAASDLQFVADRRVGRLATADAAGKPSVVPFCYAVVMDGEAPVIVSALDEKPKSVAPDQLQRVRNIRENPRVSVVVDDYSENWGELRFVQIAGEASVVEPGDLRFPGAIASLRSKYPQYATMAIERAPVLWISNLSAVSWNSTTGTASSTRPADFTALIQGRRSVRSLRPDPVPRTLVEAAIAAAGWAPSPHGRQPWRFSVVESIERKITLVEGMAATWQQQLELDGQEPEIVAIRLQKSRQRLLAAPLIVAPCLYLDGLDQYPDAERQAAEYMMAEQSLGAAIQNLLVSLYSAGLDAGWMCAPLFCPDVVRDALGLDVSLTPRALIPVGYVDKEPIRRLRLPLDQLIVDWS